MMAKSRKKQDAVPAHPPVLASGSAPFREPFGALGSYSMPPSICGDLYRALREAIPVIDAGIYKLIRLTGGFQAVCADKRFQPILDDFCQNVPADSGSVSLQGFIDCFFEQLLTYGTAVAEMVPDSTGKIRYLYNAPHTAYRLRRSKSDFRRPEVLPADDLTDTPFPRQEWLLVCTLGAQPGEVYGTPLLSGLPFVSSVLTKIYNAVGQNWERVGNVRFAVTYKPGDDMGGKAYAKERAMQIASQWSEAMRNREVRDFVAVGDVDIKVIGADNQILDSSVPIRQILEQLVSKTGIPPFMLGLSWSSTERMSTQQADLLTTEMTAIRRSLTPVIERICRLWLRMHGYGCGFQVVWDDINLQDLLEEAKADWYREQTRKLALENDRMAAEAEDAE